MGHRTLKRVPLDFDWPIGKPWAGYQDPHYRPCPCCENGYTQAGLILNKLVSLILLAGSDVVRHTQKHAKHSLLRENIPTHPWLQELGLEVVSSDMIELTTRLAGRPPSYSGHDGCDEYAVVKKILKAAGLPRNWGYCKHCGGSGDDPTTRAASKAWKPTEPPKGKSWQLWDTSGDDCPASPVFATAEDLAIWCEKHATTFGDRQATKAQWLKMFSTKHGVDAGTSFVHSKGRLGVAIEFQEP